MFNPGDYPEISSLARKFINAKPKYVPIQAKPAYQYLGEGANSADLPKLPSVSLVKEEKVHQYLSPSAIDEEVHKEFGTPHVLSVLA